ncbi:hypothetical protein [uncultured Brevundimonas sp.]|nr:hypothetical protein [uncultured Brevundimonas sp.]
MHTTILQCVRPVTIISDNGKEYTSAAVLTETDDAWAAHQA